MVCAVVVCVCVFMCVVVTVVRGVCGLRACGGRDGGGDSSVRGCVYGMCGVRGDGGGGRTLARSRKSLTRLRILKLAATTGGIEKLMRRLLSVCCNKYTQHIFFISNILPHPF